MLTWTHTTLLRRFIRFHSKVADWQKYNCLGGGNYTFIHTFTYFYILVALHSHTHTSAQTVTSPKPDMCKSGAASALDETNQRLPPNSSSTNSEPQNRESVTTCLWRLLYIHDFTDAIMWNKQNRHSLRHSIGTFGGYRCLYCFIL